MLKRFAAATVVASVAVAVAASVVLIIPGLGPRQFSPLLALWCIAPCAWGVWAMLCPAKWVPGRLPVWGTILGLVGGTLVAYVLNLPYRIFGVALSMPARAIFPLMLAVFYYLLWCVVKVVYRKFSGPTSL